MNKAELVEEVRKLLGDGGSKAAAERAVDAVCAAVKKGLRRDREVQLVGFGAFVIATRTARRGFNPHTKQAMKIRAMKTIRFKAGPICAPSRDDRRFALDAAPRARLLRAACMKALLVDKFRAAFGREPEIIARAPGRIEVIGNHTDYNGGIVLGAAIDRGVWVALARRSDGRRNFVSDQRSGTVALSTVDFEKLSEERGWANYPLGVLASLPHFGLQSPEGFDYCAVANLPAGAGLSSSAAIELASALAFLEAAEQSAPRETLVTLARRAENNFVGVPCGILDQGVSGFGRKNRLVLIDCRGPRFETVPLPAAAHFWIFNTQTKHALVDGLYAARHRECMEAAEALGVALLVEVAPEALSKAEKILSPTAFKRAKHVVEEIARVSAAVTALRAGDLEALGKLLVQSHRSSQTLFENSTAELDFLVETLAPMKDVFGARLTGGGFGGAVMALTDGTFGENEVEWVKKNYRAKFGSTPEVLHCQTDEGAELVAK